MKPKGSPLQIAKDPAYENIAVIDGQTFPASVREIVRHKTSGTLWACVYLLRDAAGETPGDWYEVEAHPRTVVDYLVKRR